MLPVCFGDRLLGELMYAVTIITSHLVSSVRSADAGGGSGGLSELRSELLQPRMPCLLSLARRSAGTREASGMPMRNDPDVLRQQRVAGPPPK